MTEQRMPWWYSGDDDADPDSSGAADEPPAPPGADAPTAPSVDWTVLAAGAQRLVNWATERVMAPHAEHDDPRAHPQCVVCRTLVVLGERGVTRDSSTDGSGSSDGPPSASGAEGAGAGGTPPVAGDIVWIPVVGEPEGP